MKNNIILKSVATLGPIGYLPASGTWATVCTLPGVLTLFSLFDTWYSQILIVVIVTVSALYVINYTHIFFDDHHDPREIVLDEVVGCCVTLCTLSLTTINVVVGCLAFRFFDIAKVAGIAQCERIKAPWGIVLDDLVAGIFANGVVRLCVYFFAMK